MSYREKYGIWRREARYTDGTPVVEGDRIRSTQAPGGIMAPSEPKTGIAAKLTDSLGDPDELYLFDGHRYYHIFGHVTEKVS